MPLGYFAMGGSLKGEDEEGEKAEKVIPSHHLAEIIRDTVKKAQTCERCLRLGLPCNSLLCDETRTCPCCEDGGHTCTRMEVALNVGDSGGGNAPALRLLEKERL